MEHIYTSRHLSSVQMSAKEDENVDRRLNDSIRIGKFDMQNQQNDDDHAPVNDHCDPSGSEALIIGPRKDLREAVSSMRPHTADVNVAASLQVSPGNCIETAADNTKLKELCYTDAGLVHSFLSEPESNIANKALVSSNSGSLTEGWKSETRERPFANYSSRQFDELNSRKHKQSKLSPDECSKDQLKQRQVRSIQNSTTGHWRHLYQLAASAGNRKALGENSKEAASHTFKMPPTQGCNFDQQEQLQNWQNEQDCCSKMMQDYSETANMLKLKAGISQSSLENRQLLQGSQESAHMSGGNNSYHSPLLTNRPMTQMTEGIRTKILSASGISHICVMDSLNDTRGKAARQVTFPSDSFMSLVRNPKLEREMRNTFVEGNSETAGNSSTNASNINMQGCIGMNDVALHNGISLRRWLGQSSRIVDKIESLHIFKQILELVEHAHSQGVCLRNIRPSCFVLSSLNRVIFLESTATQASSGDLEHPICSSSIPAVQSSKLHQNKKRSRQYLAMEEVRGHGFVDGLQSSNQIIKPSNKDGMQSERQQNGADGSFQKQGSGSFVRSLSLDQYTGQACERYLEHSRTPWPVDGKSLSKDEHNSGCRFNEDQQQVMEQSGWQHRSSLQECHADDFHSMKEDLTLEENWYTSPEELNEGTCTLASNIYSLGVLLFELFCTFATWEEQVRIMSDLRHRILSPRFLSEHPKEAGFCLWLLHPEPSSRPKAREIAQSELLNEAQDALAERQAAVNVDEEDAESGLLLDFLQCLQKQKQERACKLAQDVACLTSDIEEVERRRSFLLSGGPVSTSCRDSALLSKGRIFGDTENDSQNCADGEEKVNSGKILADQEPFVAGAQQSGPHSEESPSKSHALMSKGARMMQNFKHLEQVYFAMRCKIETPVANSGGNCWRQGQKVQDLSNQDAIEPRDKENGNADRLGCFFDSVCKYARYSHFEVRATLRHGDLLNTANVVCSVGFDRDQEFFATAGVSKKIKVFDCDAVLNENVDIHYPVVEMISKSKLSSVCWNSYIKSHIASTDYDGIVQLWDASTGQRFAQYCEHKKRAWSVDFAQADPTKLASGSDDCTVKLWSINQEGSIGTIKTVANVCCVQFPPDSAHMITFGSADYKVYCYDLRNTKLPWCTLASHGKAVSYVKFIDSRTIVSASTDNTLKLWDLAKTSSSAGTNGACTVTFTGHTNEKNFVGLSVSEGYIACGSETNAVFAYYKSLPMPMASHKFGFVDPISGQETQDDNGQFVSSVCWRGKSQILVAANSTGNIKLLEMT